MPQRIWQVVVAYTNNTAIVTQVLTVQCAAVSCAMLKLNNSRIYQSQGGKLFSRYSDQQPNFEDKTEKKVFFNRESSAGSDGAVCSSAVVALQLKDLPRLEENFEMF